MRVMSKSTGDIVNVKRYCRATGMWCEMATINGWCKVTACVHPEWERREE